MTYKYVMRSLSKSGRDVYIPHAALKGLKDYVLLLSQNHFQNYCKLYIFSCTKLRQKLQHQSQDYVNNKSDINLRDSGNKNSRILHCGYAGLLVLHSLLLLNPSLAHRLNVASLSLFYWYYFGRCSSGLAQLVPLPYSRGRSTRYSDGLHEYSVTIPRCYKDASVKSFFPRTARLWNSLPIECFALTYDLNSFKSRIKRHLLSVGPI